MNDPKSRAQKDASDPNHLLVKSTPNASVVPNVSIKSAPFYLCRKSIISTPVTRAECFHYFLRSLFLFLIFFCFCKKKIVTQYLLPTSFVPTDHFPFYLHATPLPHPTWCQSYKLKIPVNYRRNDFSGISLTVFW